MDAQLTGLTRRQPRGRGKRELPDKREIGSRPRPGRDGDVETGRLSRPDANARQTPCGLRENESPHDSPQLEQQGTTDDERNAEEPDEPIDPRHAPEGFEPAQNADLRPIHRIEQQ